MQVRVAIDIKFIRQVDLEIAHGPGEPCDQAVEQMLFDLCHKLVHAFFDAFVDEAIEANNCFYGGGGYKDELRGFIELGRKDENPKRNLDRIIAWMEARSDVSSYLFGNITDAWYGPFDDEDESA